jgi:hypothetical protein
VYGEGVHGEGVGCMGKGWGAWGRGAWGGGMGDGEGVHGDGVRLHGDGSGKLMHVVHPDTGISSKAMAILNSFVKELIGHIATKASKLAAYSKNQPSHHGRSRLQFASFFLAKL